MNSIEPGRDRSATRRLRWTVIGIEFIIMFAFWLVLSGHFEIKFMAIGIGAAALVTFLTHDLLYSSGPGEKTEKPAYLFKCALGMVLYLPWLVVAIVKANIQVAAIIIQPRMPINPGLLQFQSKLTKKVALVTLANSITLTPGTITVELANGKYLVHSLVPDSAGDLESGLMQNKVANVFCDSKETAPPDCHWANSLEDLK